MEIQTTDVTDDPLSPELYSRKKDDEQVPRGMFLEHSLEKVRLALRRLDRSRIDHLLSYPG